MTPEERAERVAADMEKYHSAQLGDGGREFIAEQIREAVAAEHERWVLVGVCDPTARPGWEPDPRGFVHYILSAKPEVLTAALERLRGHATGIVGGYTPLPIDQFAAIAKASGTTIGYAIEVKSDGQSIRYEAPTAEEVIRLAAIHEAPTRE